MLLFGCDRNVVAYLMLTDIFFFALGSVKRLIILSKSGSYSTFSDYLFIYFAFSVDSEEITSGCLVISFIMTPTDRGSNLVGSVYFYFLFSVHSA